ncbi:hypothetical protein PF010_g7179 [Phytophthora fragariae]|uniref:Uncharacterized protein n=1 Tax=Phytophthora fragariae TaxID=53985 RepID=A0A6G0LIS5_9STRA|nr:hypothetical protein PF010_g7179 [Phytophthora fragariae]
MLLIGDSQDDTVEETCDASATIAMLLMGSSQDDTVEETCDASVRAEMLLMSSSPDDTVEETCDASVIGNDSGLSSLEKLGLYRATSSEMDTPSVYSAAFAMQTNSAEHENSSYTSSSDAQSYHRLNAGNDTTCPSFDDVGRCDIERMDFEVTIVKTAMTTTTSSKTMTATSTQTLRDTRTVEMNMGMLRSLTSET